MSVDNSTVREAQNVIAQLLAPGLKDPYPLYSWLRDNAPVVYSERHDAYLLSRFADCALAFRSPLLFRTPEHDTLMELLPQTVEYEPYRALFSSLVDGTPQPYAPLRRRLGQLLTPDVVRYIRDVMRRVSDEVLDSVAAADDGTPVDLHSALSVPIGELSIATLLGVQPADLPEATKLMRRLLRLMEAAPTQSGLTAATTAYRALADFVADLLADSRRSPGGNLVTMLAHGKDGQAQLTDDQIRTVLITLWGGAVEKAVITLDNAALAVLRRPDLVEWLRDEEIASAFVDELYRWDGPAQISTSPRYAVGDVEMSGGHVVPAGAEVRMLIGAANRDPEAYPQPTMLLPSRVGPDPLLSGAGFLPCVGTGLARLQLCITMPHLLDRFPELSLAGEPVWRRALPLREPRSVPVRLGVGAAHRTGVPVGAAMP
jgi:cytochrome P450